MTNGAEREVGYEGPKRADQLRGTSVTFQQEP
jgi:hypothetical protein